MAKKGGSEGVSALQFLPARVTMTSLREAARKCQGCPLFQNATQTVFGQGERSARVLFVGDQTARVGLFGGDGGPGSFGPGFQGQRRARPTGSLQVRGSSARHRSSIVDFA